MRRTATSLALGLVLMGTTAMCSTAPEAGDTAGEEAGATANQESGGEAATAAGGDAGETAGDGASASEPASKIVRLLADDQVVFGVFSGDKTAEQGAVIAETGADFVFYSMESGPFDIPQMRVYMEAMLGSIEGDSLDELPVALRIPPIRDDPAAARERVARALEAGVHAIVFPHVETAEEAELAVEAVDAADREVVNVLLIEDQVGVENARQIVGTPGVDVVIPGPGDLSRAYERDAEAVENAIQTVLAACRELDVPCGITAGVDDIGERIEQGFELFIVTQPEAIAVGKRAAGRQ